jgi:hypothetical protein
MACFSHPASFASKSLLRAAGGLRLLRYGSLHGLVLGVEAAMVSVTWHASRTQLL